MRRTILILCCFALLFSFLSGCKEEPRICVDAINQYEDVDSLYQAVIEAKQKEAKGEKLNGDEASVIFINQILVPIIPQEYDDSIEYYGKVEFYAATIMYYYEFLFPNSDGELEKKQLNWDVTINMNKEDLDERKQFSSSFEGRVLTEDNIIYDEAMSYIQFEYESNWISIRCPGLPYEELLKFTQFETIEIP